MKELKEKATRSKEEVKDSKIKIKPKFVDSLATNSAIALQHKSVMSEVDKILLSSSNT